MRIGVDGHPRGCAERMRGLRCVRECPGRGLRRGVLGWSGRAGVQKMGWRGRDLCSRNARTPKRSAQCVTLVLPLPLHGETERTAGGKLEGVLYAVLSLNPACNQRDG